MKKALIAVAALGLFAVGCEEKSDVKKSDVEKAAETVKTETKQATSDAGKATGGAMEKTGDAMKDAGTAMKEKAAEMAPDATKAVEDLYTKAKAAVDSGRLEDAKPLIEQLKTYVDKVPPEWQEKIKTLVAEYGKKAMSGAAGAIPGMPK